MAEARGAECRRPISTGWPTRACSSGRSMPSRVARPAAPRCRPAGIPNRSGMTTVAFQGQGGGLPAAEWTLASVLKTAGYKTFFTGKWHLGEADYALPNAHGYDEMRHVGLYHLNAYTYADPTWFPDMDPELREMFAERDQGRPVGEGRRARRGKISRSTASMSIRRSRAWSASRSSTAMSRRRHSIILTRMRNVDRAAVHERQLHEAAPAEHARPGLRPPVAVQDQVRRFRGRARRAHRAHRGEGARARHWSEHARRLHDRQRRLAGRLSRLRLYAVPRHQGYCPRGRQPGPRDRLDAGQDRGRHARTTTSSAAST